MWEAAPADVWVRTGAEGCVYTAGVLMVGPHRAGLGWGSGLAVRTVGPQEPRGLSGYRCRPPLAVPLALGRRSSGQACCRCPCGLEHSPEGRGRKCSLLGGWRAQGPAGRVSGCHCPPPRDDVWRAGPPSSAVGTPVLRARVAPNQVGRVPAPVPSLRRPDPRGGCVMRRAAGQRWRGHGATRTTCEGKRGPKAAVGQRGAERGKKGLCLRLRGKVDGPCVSH